MSTKADYLKRYASKDTDNSSSKPEKKRRKKISSRSTVSQRSGLTVLDEDISWQTVAPSSGRIDEAWERAGAEDDAPVVVSASHAGEEEAYVSRGTWEDVTVSSSQSSPSRRRRDASPSASPPRRRREASPSASPPRRRRQASPSASPPRRRRHASPSASPPRRRRHASPSASPPRRRKEASPSASPPRRRREASQSPPRKSATSAEETAGERASGKREKSVKRVETTSTGHKAGLQSAEDLKAREEDLKRKRQEDIEEANRQQASSGTVYRDKRGKKLDMLNEFMRTTAVSEGKEEKMKQAQFEWGRGAVQKEQTQQTIEQLQAMADAPFARTIDDADLEKEKKAIIRDGDPMAAYFNSLQEQTEQEVAVRTGKPRKPRYEGPAPTPNRFRIAPGYRWDAIDRGNRFESMLLKKINARGSLKEDEYRWSTSDM